MKVGFDLNLHSLFGKKEESRVEIVAVDMGQLSKCFLESDGLWGFLLLLLPPNFDC